MVVWLWCWELRDVLHPCDIPAGWGWGSCNPTATASREGGRCVEGGCGAPMYSRCHCIWDTGL